MQRHTKEYKDVIRAFEASLRSMPFYTGYRLDKEKDPNNKHGHYENGQLNELFIAFMYGYACAKSTYQSGE